MHPVETYKYFGLLGIMGLAVGLSFIAIKWPVGIDYTFSQHSARQRQSIIYHFLMSLITSIPILLFLVYWFGPTYKMGILYYIFVWVGVITQLLCTLFPETKGFKANMHRFLAFTSGDCMMPIALLIGLNTKVATIPRIITLVSLAVMIILVSIIAKFKNRPPKFLLIQSAYYIVFFGSVLIAAYVT